MHRSGSGPSRYMCKLPEHVTRGHLMAGQRVWTQLTTIYQLMISQRDNSSHRHLLVTSEIWICPDLKYGRLCQSHFIWPVIWPVLSHARLSTHHYLPGNYSHTSESRYTSGMVYALTIAPDEYIYIGLCKPSLHIMQFQKYSFMFLLHCTYNQIEILAKKS